MSEGDAVEHVARLRVDEFQLDMLLLTAYHLRCAVVVDITGAEDGLGIIGSVRSEFLQVVMQFLVDILEVDDGIDVEGGLRLLRQDMLIDIFLETATELGYVLNLQREADGIGMTAEVLQQVAAVLYGVVDVIASHAAGRSRGDAVELRQHHRRPVVELRQAGGDDADDTFLPVLVVEHDA